MALRCIAKDPESKTGASPTVWVDEATGDVLLQGWMVDEAVLEECRGTGPIPDSEFVVRLPARLAGALREAADVAERAAG
ncbi:hypothetical protein LO772_15345 [Yinghuangia sp. ASG 101]|uniref:hypothetical protein n=1 Tax=Yinghuangia sp. ASG 101 TaxID=2896848 RepID=UPI001E618702|nr:hypothetical protein [Yinghuangia sp. ASG 101]UGQ14820.1 hypothetical protein LO772_15345 [Yinghuangia sp. ASG 101]